MDPKERVERLSAGAAILTVLKLYGVSVKEVAEDLNVSTTTISHWRGTASIEKSRVGAPSNDELRQMSMMLVAAISRSHSALNVLIRCGFFPENQIGDYLGWIEQQFKPVLDSVQNKMEEVELYRKNYEAEVMSLPPEERYRKSSSLYDAQNKWGRGFGSGSIKTILDMSKLENAHTDFSHSDRLAMEKAFQTDLKDKFQRIQGLIHGSPEEE